RRLGGEVGPRGWAVRLLRLLDLRRLLGGVPRGPLAGRLGRALRAGGLEQGGGIDGVGEGALNRREVGAGERAPHAVGLEGAQLQEGADQLLVGHAILVVGWVAGVRGEEQVLLAQDLSGLLELQGADLADALADRPRRELAVALPPG